MLYYLSLGSNLGNREETLHQAVQMIEQQVGHVLRCSSFFYSAPWGFNSVNDFCNLCCAVETSQSPLTVLLTTQTIEQALGRKKKTQDGQYSDRSIDIDLIRAFDDTGKEIKCEITNDPNLQPPTSKLLSPLSSIPLLTLPHPLWEQRDFVKIPLSEIMP